MSADSGSASFDPITIDLGETISLKGFTYTPRQDGKTEGIIYEYNFYVSEDGTSWEKVIAKGVFDNIRNNPIKQYVKWEKQHSARFIKLEVLSTVNENEDNCSGAEIGVLTD